MTTDFRALCVELTDCLEKADWPHQRKVVFQQWIDIAHAALAEPEPEVPTDEELLHTATIALSVNDIEPDEIKAETELYLYGSEIVKIARAVLARWGNHPGSPDSSTQPS